MDMDISVHLLNSLVLILSALIASNTYRGYRVTSSPTMLRLSIAFIALASASLLDILSGVGFIPVAAAYFFLAYAYTIQGNFKYMLPLFLLVTFALIPFFNISNVEYISRAVAFILIVYAGTQSMVVALSKRARTTLFIASGISIIALSEFVSWYAMIFRVDLYHYAYMTLKVIGIALIYTIVQTIVIRSAQYRKQLT